MAKVDYEAHNFICYTVPECSSDVETDDSSDETPYDSMTSLSSQGSKAEIKVYNDLLRRQKLYLKHKKRSLVPRFPTSQRRSFMLSSSPPQLGYFVSFAANTVFNTPSQRIRYREKENDRNRRAVSYGGTSHDVGSLPRAAPRRISLMKEPPPPPPPKPAQLVPVKNASGTPLLPSKYEQSDYNLIQNVDSNSGLTTTAQYQLPNFYVNARESTESYTMTNNNNNYSSLLCHGNSASSPTAVRKREKLLHRFSDAATLGRKLKKKKNTNRTCRSMTEAIEMLADPVIEDEFFVSIAFTYLYTRM